MKNKDTLTKKVLTWQKSGVGYEDLVKEISAMVYSYPKRHFCWTEDQCSDFYCYFYKRIEKIMNGFRYCGIPFRSYLYRSIKCQVHTFHRKTQKKQQQNALFFHESKILIEEHGDFMKSSKLRPSGHAVHLLQLDRRKDMLNTGAGRRVIMLALKSAPYLTDSHIEAVSKMTGCSEDWFFEKVSKLRRITERRNKRIKEFDLRINRAYMQIYQLHTEISSGLAFETDEVENKLSSVKQRMDKALKGRESLRTVPTNREIADVLDVPKGSIDSGLYYIKKSLQPLLEE